jgi:Ala-tRNA(Pro) deacylase
VNVFELLNQAGVSYRVSEHPPVYSAQMMAAAEHVKGQCVAKSVIVKVAGAYVMCVLAAPDKIIFDKLRTYSCTKDVMLAEEGEIRGVFPDCEEGAEPPFGRLYNMRTIMDCRLKKDNTHITFQAGTHDQAIYMAVSDYIKVAEPEIVDFAYHPRR